jgi:predicted metal-binding membrane protein
VARAGSPAQLWAGATGPLLLAAAAAAWLALAAYEPPMGAAGFLVGWTLMMAAMMLPSIAPLAALARGGQARLAAGYLAVWSAIGLLPWAAMDHGLSPALPLVLAAAGAYELSPLKGACLRRCRNPVGFLMEHYRSGPFRLGVEHGLWCIGCCAGLMVVLVLAASMSIGWAAVLAGIVFAQKVLPLGETWARITGAALLFAASVTLVS